MGRSGYYDDGSEGNWPLICWRGAVKKAIEGKRGQAFLKEMLETLDSMPEKKLIKGELMTQQGEVCAIGSVMVKRSIDPDVIKRIDVTRSDIIAQTMGISDALVREIEFINDDGNEYMFESESGKWMPITPEKRFEIVHDWVLENIKG